MSDRQLFIDGCQKLNIELTEEKMARIDQYALLLEKWAKKINIIGPETIPYIYSRHILDSAQVVPFISSDDFVLDIGAGAGLPSIVIAILSGAKVNACERVGKKIQFMREVKRQLNLGDSFYALQEDVYKMDKPEDGYSVVTSRAFSELENILKAGKRLMRDDAKFVLLKGEALNDEIKNAKSILNMTQEEKESITFTGGKILVLK